MNDDAESLASENAALHNMKIFRIVLAAGAGRRMGQIKALLDLGGLSALQRIAALKLGQLPMTTRVVCGYEAATVAREANACGLGTATNRDWAAGQTGSLQVGIASESEADYFLLHPVDLPLIAQADYDALAKAMTEDPGRKIYVTSIDNRRGHPVIIAQKIAKQLLQLGSDDSIRPIIQAEADVVYAAVENLWVRQDLDTPDDLQAALDYLGKSGESKSP